MIFFELLKRNLLLLFDGVITKKEFTSFSYGAKLFWSWIVSEWQPSFNLLFCLHVSALPETPPQPYPLIKFVKFLTVILEAVLKKSKIKHLIPKRLIFLSASMNRFSVRTLHTIFTNWFRHEHLIKWKVIEISVFLVSEISEIFVKFGQHIYILIEVYCVFHVRNIFSCNQK